MASDRGNVTFTISNEPPPRTNLFFQKIPLGVVDRQRLPSVSDIVTRRLDLGDLIFSVSRSARTEEGNTAKQYEIGQVLDFADVALQTVDPMLVGVLTEIQHNNNILDYEIMGLTEDEQQLLADNALQTQDLLTDQLNLVRQERANADQTINSNQKTINEINRTLSAIEIIIANAASTDGSLRELVDKLTSRLNEVTAARDEAIVQANNLAAQADTIIGELRGLGIIVK